jgi:hypothetical protein
MGAYAYLYLNIGVNTHTVYRLPQLTHVQLSVTI